MFDKDMTNNNKYDQNASGHKPWDVLYSIIRTLTIALLGISLAVAVPLLWRNFYYMHVDALHLAEHTPWSRAEIIEAFDEMMDYCMLGAPFDTGVLKWSNEGMEHFRDCRLLFALDIHVLIVSTMMAAALFAIKKVGAVRELRPLGRGPLFWGGFTEIILITTVLGGVIFVDFNKAFIIFHRLFFPDKTNWLFDPAKDQIIRILPEVYFRNCAILIGVIMTVFGALMMLLDFNIGRKVRNQNSAE